MIPDSLTGKLSVVTGVRKEEKTSVDGEEALINVWVCWS